MLIKKAARSAIHQSDFSPKMIGTIPLDGLTFPSLLLACQLSKTHEKQYIIYRSH